MNGEVSSWIPPEIPQPSAKTLEAVDKLASYMKAKAAENPPEPKEPKGPRVRSDDGRFAGVRLNEEEVPRLPIFPAQWAIDDPRQRPYLVVWGNGAYALKMAPTQHRDAVVVTLVSGESYRIPILRRALSRGGTALFYLCPWCRKPRRFLYLQTLIGDELVEYLGPLCLLCAGLRFASQGRYRTKLAREFAPILGPRPRKPRDPWAVSDPRIAEKATEDRTPRSESPEVFDGADDADDIDLDDEDQETCPYPGRPRAPKLARPRQGAGADEPNDQALALIERFAKGVTGRLSSPIQNGILSHSGA